LIEQARRERETGRSGAARALFRHVFAALDAQSREAASPPADEDDDD
jgi:hypothetical protein